jgi:hypothetical protein
MSHVTIPCDIEILGSSCFSECQSLSSISFESNSPLRVDSSDVTDYNRRSTFEGRTRGQMERIRSSVPEANKQQNANMMNGSPAAANGKVGERKKEEAGRESAASGRREIAPAMRKRASRGNQQDERNIIEEKERMNGESVNQRKVNGKRKYGTEKKPTERRFREEREDGKSEVQLYGSIIFLRFDK